ncbi:MAG: LPS export ABC transporter periplasmic protein LptC [Bacteroidales bacterium]|nr:LPS export ABC transporter periplasmic protein LptC [Bacteroidales bacterium]
MMATTSVVAFVVFSCKGKLGEAESLNLSEMPVQRVENMFTVQTKNGVVIMRTVANLTERYDKDTLTYETFPKGIAVYSYTDDGLLETTLFADNARHETNKRTNVEKWAAYGNVEIENVIKKQLIQTDTIYWDRTDEKLYTDCYVRMSSPDGFMQGYGMRSDQKANNSIILRPFNSYAVVVQDTTAVVIDSVNFIGPFPKKR